MKKAFLSIVFFAFVGLLMADNEGTKSPEAPAEPAATVTLSGSVVDFTSGEALTGVEVKVEGTDLTVYTDFDGNFEITVKPGTYNLIASYISYKNSLVENYRVEQTEDNLDIKLQEEK
ncbi:MAG TPA: carboxypeptidase-like regulatory domain-containing protein [Bacteroidales bacterium]|nr:carboxypeptidase-like regulatory domain-containing protein [Bacteroidales bacterium]HRX97638.1 carboxypeptidase-like regulatory domain-containing protein [Bacteroidales bacterium]